MTLRQVGWRRRRLLKELPLRAAAGGRPLVAAAQRRPFGLLGLCGGLVAVGDAVENSPAALLHPLEIHHVGGHGGQLLGHADLEDS